MYLKKVHIQNIKSIKDFEMQFEEPAGWHVLLGDNGSGKSTIVKAIALGLLGREQSSGLRQNWNDWLSRSFETGEVSVDILLDQHDPLRNQPAIKKTRNITLRFKRNLPSPHIQSEWEDSIDWQLVTTGWFSAGFGPFRRFEGGNNEWRHIFDSRPRLGAHLSLFGEDVSFSHALEWLTKLHYQKLENNSESFQFDCIQQFINSKDFLPNGIALNKVSSDGVFFENKNGEPFQISLLSDGYRSILSMTFELIRLMTNIYGPNLVFEKIREGEMIIDLPGVVLIDEIDVHLHPSWQLRIGEWFLKYFPKIQFIVTTHSPLICRASEKGSIWHLKADNSDGDSPRVSKLDYDRLVYGNILDAYGTELFGASTVRSQKSNEKLERLGRLNLLAAFGKITADEEKERHELQLIMSTDDPFGA